ncbi:DUF4406 domain-containing protein [Vibrio owensii]|uniref:DUF4406 domain-containing protein n=1 Tax=Vibrio owensii TaxID=696485 RepID=UPI0010524C14|nr:DUF4406 domain-containing protein [Vibrio owensii]TDE19260.1 DUF4406 domain-containing protein [Vibrio owensii]
MKKIYIAGPMTGLPETNCPTFHKVDVNLSRKGFHVLNPALLPDGLSQAEYMDICCAMVRSADAVVLLQGWEQSQGATAEYHLAKKLGKTVFMPSEKMAAIEAWAKPTPDNKKDALMLFILEEIQAIEPRDFLESIGQMKATGVVNNKLDLFLNLAKHIEQHQRGLAA